MPVEIVLGVASKLASAKDPITEDPITAFTEAVHAQLGLDLAQLHWPLGAQNHSLRQAPQ